MYFQSSTDQSDRKPSSFHFSIHSLVMPILCAALLLIGTQQAFAQAETGTITGTVTDQSGAVVSDANVTVTGTNTGSNRTTKTTSSGLYTVSNLQPGTYDINITRTGFATFRQRVNVTVGSRISTDAKLSAAGASTEVEVVAGSIAEVNTESPALSQVVNSTAIVELPTITRNPYDLVATAGNVSQDPNGATKDRGAGVAINGQRSASTDILLDGGENVDTFSASVGQNVPLDSVQEFRVMTNNFTAEYGRASGGVVNVATRSGTNAFHGTAYEFYRGAALSANTPENKASGCPDACDPLPNNNFVRNQFGYSVGGPVIKNKLFFFNNTEWIRVRSSSLSQYYVPTPEFLAASAPTTQAFFNAYGQLAAPITQTIEVPGVNLPAGTPTLGLVTVPIPTDVGGGDPQNTVETVGRVDMNLTDATQIYGRYALQDSNFFPGTISDSPYAGFLTGETIRNQNILLNLTHLFGTSFVSQSKVVFNRLNDLQPINGAPVPTLFYRGSRATVEGKSAYLPGFLPGSPGAAIPFGGPQNLYQFYEDLSITHGSHNFRFGGMYLHIRDNRAFGAYEEAVEQLGTDLTSGLNNLLAGQLVLYRAAINPQGKFPCQFDYTTGTAIEDPSCSVTLPATQPKFGRNNRYNDFAVYAQDTWKLFPRFTLTLGARYEYYGVQHNADPSLDANFYFGQGSNFFEQYRNGSAQRAQDSPIGKLWSPDWNNVAPRVGFAWDVLGDGSTSFRAGYGIAFERNFGNVTFNVIQNPPNYAVVSLTPADVGGTLPISVENLGSFASGTGSTPLVSPSVRHISQNIRTAYSEMWNASFERQVFRGSVMALEYSGSRGLKLYSLEDPNRYGSGVTYLGDDPSTCLTDGSTCYRLNQNYGTGSYNRANRGFSYYNGLNVRFQTADLFNSGVQFTANYTWSHATDNLSSTFSDAFTNYNVGLLDPFNPALDKGAADFDVRHRFVISGIWSEPWLKKGHGILGAILGGWQVAPIVTVRSGTPFSLYDFSNPNGFYAPRPLLTGSPTEVAGGGTGNVMGANLFEYLAVPANVGGYVNALTGSSELPDCTTPGQGATGTCPWPSNMARRNMFYGPSNWSFNTGLYKNFNITENVRIQLRGEFYNLFNHPNNYIEAGSLDVSGCGTGPSTCIVPVKKGYLPDGTADKRDVQVGAKFIF
jgi:hypothetical protein